MDVLVARGRCAAQPGGIDGTARLAHPGGADGAPCRGGGQPRDQLVRHRFAVDRARLRNGRRADLPQLSAAQIAAQPA